MQEARVGAAVGNALIDTIEDMDLGEITDGVFVCTECRDEYELEDDIIMFGLCGNCHKNGEVKK